MRSAFLLLLLCVFLVACADEPCPEGMVRISQDRGAGCRPDCGAGGMIWDPVAMMCVADVDSGSGDGGTDAGPCGECADDTPVCDTSSATPTCVGCRTSTDCVAPRPPFCDTGTNACIACLGHADCTDPTAARCDADMCVACTDSAECAGIVGAEACHVPTGTCVECTVETETTDCAAPNNFACHPTDLTCTGQERRSLGFCQACVSDSECVRDGSGMFRCVPMMFEGSPHGSYCLLDQATLSPPGPCPDRMTADRLAMSVLDIEATYCFVKENLTTCDAVLGFDRRCPLGDVDCGAPGLDDGYCDSGTCTYECSSMRDCSSSLCAGGVTTYCE